MNETFTINLPSSCRSTAAFNIKLLQALPLVKLWKRGICAELCKVSRAGNRITRIHCLPPSHGPDRLAFPTVRRFHRHPVLIPSNNFAVVSLRELADLSKQIFKKWLSRTNASISPMNWTQRSKTPFGFQIFLCPRFRTRGISSPHFGRDDLRRFRVIVQAMTSDKEIVRCLQILKTNRADTGFMYESFYENDPKDFTLH